MIRPMACDVSTLSGGVANGHQIMHFVSFALSKIPLRWVFRSTASNQLNVAAIFAGAFSPAYKAATVRLLGLSVLSVSGLASKRTEIDNPNHWSSGPWLPDRFYGPASSSLTMATSAPLERPAV